MLVKECGCSGFNPKIIHHKDAGEHDWVLFDCDGGKLATYECIEDGIENIEGYYNDFGSTLSRCANIDDEVKAIHLAFPSDIGAMEESSTSHVYKQSQKSTKSQSKNFSLLMIVLSTLSLNKSCNGNKPIFMLL